MASERELDRMADDSAHAVAEVVKSATGKILSIEQIEEINDALYPILRKI